MLAKHFGKAGDASTNQITPTQSQTTAPMVQSSVRRQPWSHSRQKRPGSPMDKQALLRREKNLKKKERKKKQKMQKLLEQYEATNRLRNMLKDIYYERATFESCQPDLPAIVNKIREQEHFFQILNETITLFIEDLAESVWQQLAHFINSCDVQDFMLQYEKLEEYPEFFTILVEQLCLTHQKIRVASRHVQKILAFYIKTCCNYSTELEEQQYNLSRSTLNHLINCNSFLKCAIICCQNFCGVSGQKLEGKRFRFQSQLKQLLKNVQIKEDPYEDSDLMDSDSTEGEGTTCCASQCQSNQEHRSPKKKSSKKVKKQKKETKVTQIAESEQNLQMKLTCWLQNLEIPQYRVPCSYENEWLEGLSRHRYEKSI